MTKRNSHLSARDCGGPPDIARWRKKKPTRFIRQTSARIGNRLPGGWFWRSAFVVWLGVLLTSCTPQEPGQSADEQEPHFVLGEHRVDAMDYRGAIQAFEESLQVDPHSAAAQFQLGWLYDAKVPDPAAAIYHYEQYLKLEPNADNAVVVKQRIEACKQALAADVLGLPNPPGAQKQIGQLVTRNQRLQNEIQQLQEENQQLRAGLKRWSDYCDRLLAQRTNSLATGLRPVAKTPTDDFNPSQPVNDNDGPPLSPVSRRTEDWRTHTVVAGETAVRIAHDCGISLETLLAANPGLKPRRMPVGLVLNIPPPRKSVPPFLEVGR